MITLHEVEQGTEEWHELRRGILTASEIKHIITPTLKVADNEKTRQHLWELMAQRVSGYVEPSYISDDMLRGMMDEALAKDLYAQKYAPTTDIGFVTNSRWGFTIGHSPDALVGDDGIIECKSRRQKFQVETITLDEVPSEYMLQLQTGLLVTERKWVDYVSYCGGLPMYVKRVYRDERVQEAIVNAAEKFEANLAVLTAQYLDHASKFHPTQRMNNEDDVDLV